MFWNKNIYIQLRRLLIPSKWCLFVTFIFLITQLVKGQTEYEKEIQSSRSHRDRVHVDLDVITGRKERSNSQSGHLSNAKQAKLRSEALSMYNISTERVAKLDNLAKEARLEAAAKQTTNLQLFMHASNHTLEKMRSLHHTLTKVKTQVSTQLATHLTRIVGSPYDCRPVNHTPASTQDGTAAAYQDPDNAASTRFFSDPDQMSKLSVPAPVSNSSSNFSASISASGTVMVTLESDRGADGVDKVSNFTLTPSDSTRPVVLCDSMQDVPELPVLIKWLLGLDSAAATVQPPKMARTVRNVMAAFLVAMVILCLGFCLGTRVHSTPLQAPPHVSSLPMPPRHRPLSHLARDNLRDPILPTHNLGGGVFGGGPGAHPVLPLRSTFSAANYMRTRTKDT